MAALENKPESKKASRGFIFTANGMEIGIQTSSRENRGISIKQT